MDRADRGTIEDVIKYIHDGFSQVANRHRDREVEWYNEDHNYRAAINEILDIKSEAVLTFEYFLDPSSSQTTTMVRSTTVRRNERKFRKHLERRMLDRATPAVERKDLAIKLCKCEVRLKGWQCPCAFARKAADVIARTLLYLVPLPMLTGRGIVFVFLCRA